MFFIILGVILVIVSIIISCKYYDINECLLGIILGIILSVCIGLGLGLPGTDIGHELISTTELVSLADDISISGRGRFYVTISPTKTYSYYYEVDSEFKKSDTEKSYKQGLVKGNYVTIVECDDMSGEVPTLYEYKAGKRKNFWTFSIDGIYNEYVFRVPKGTILQQFELDG